MTGRRVNSDHCLVERPQNNDQMRQAINCRQSTNDDTDAL